MRNVGNPDRPDLAEKNARPTRAEALLQYRCTPLRAWLLPAACDANRERQRAGGEPALMVAECAGCAGVLARAREGLEPSPRSADVKISAPATTSLARFLPRNIAGNLAGELRSRHAARRLEAAAETLQLPDPEPTPEEDPVSKTTKNEKRLACKRCKRPFAHRAWLARHESACSAMPHDAVEVAEPVQTPAPAAAVAVDVSITGGDDLIAQLVAKRLALLEQAAEIERALQLIADVARKARAS